MTASKFWHVTEAEESYFNNISQYQDHPKTTPTAWTVHYTFFGNQFQSRHSTCILKEVTATTSGLWGSNSPSLKCLFHCSNPITTQWECTVVITFTCTEEPFCMLACGLQPGIAWLTFYRSDIRVAVRLRCRLCTMISRDPYSKSNIGRDHYCQIRPAGVTLLWGDEFFLGILKFGWSSQCYWNDWW